MELSKPGGAQPLFAILKGLFCLFEALSMVQAAPPDCEALPAVLNAKAALGALSLVLKSRTEDAQANLEVGFAGWEDPATGSLGKSRGQWVNKCVQRQVHDKFLWIF